MEESFVEYQDFPKICRLCLNKGDLKSILYEPEFLQNLTTITRLRVSPSDKLPQNVCTACIEKFDYVNSFIDVCVTSDTILKAIVLQEENKNFFENIEIQLTPNEIKERVVEEIRVKLEPSKDNEEDIITLKVIKNENSTKINIRTNEEINENKEKSLTCSACDKVFLSLVSLRRHAKSHKTVKKRNDICKCIYCHKNFTRKSTLQRHLRIHTGVKPFTCNFCNRKFAHKNVMDRHKLIHRRKISCTICNKSFSRKSYLENHKKTHDSESTKNLYKNSLAALKCSFCGESFSSVWFLRSHLRTHTGKTDSQCDICQKLFPTKGSLERHYVTHTKIKAFKCDECEAAFNSNILLEKHKKYHDETSEDKRKLTCKECGKYFLFPSHLQRHIVIHNSSQKAKPDRPKWQPKRPAQYLCSYCGKQFNQASNLTVHIRTHTGERFNCDICDNTYSTKDSLKTHMLAHKGEKPYPCPYCGKKFRKPSLYKHILIHKGIRQYKCEVCTKSFIRKDQLGQHLLTHN